MSNASSAQEHSSTSGAGSIANFNVVTELNWVPDAGCGKQMFIKQWMENAVRSNWRGATIQDSYCDLLPPDTLFSKDVLQGLHAPSMYKELRDLIHCKGGPIEKRRGLPIKKALAYFYGEPEIVKEALDLDRAVLEEEHPKLSSVRSESCEASKSTSSIETTKGTVVDRDYTPDHPFAQPRGYQRLLGSVPEPEIPRREFNAKGNLGENDTHPQQRRQPHNHAAQQEHPFSFTPPQQRMTRPGSNVSQHAVNVLSKLSTRFKDKSDKYGGDEGENWEDIYSTYLSCCVEWGVPEDAAFRNIDNILTGEARTYYKRKVKSNPTIFRCCDDVHRFILDTFHGHESQEATLEHLDSLSMITFAKDSGSLVSGLKSIRDEIVKHVNLVPENRQNEMEQKRWLKRAVRMYRWARPTTARSNELDFAKMYSTLRSQAIEEEKSRMTPGSGSYRSKIGDKTLGNAVWFGDMYGKSKTNPKHKPYSGKNKGTRPFAGSCFGCGRKGFKRVDCPDCKQDKPSHQSDVRKAFKSINTVSSISDAANIISDIRIQYGEGWEELLREEDNSELSDDGSMDFADDDDQSSEEEADGSFPSQFSEDENGILLCENDDHTPNDPADVSMPAEIPELQIHSSKISARGVANFEGVCLDTGAVTSVCGYKQAFAYAKFAGFKLRLNKSARTFKFGNARSQSLGTLVARMPIPGHSFIEVTVDVVRPNIPLLIGLDALDKNNVYVNNVRNLLVHDKLDWNVPLVRKHGHVYYKWDKEILFTLSELKKMHLGFYHPSTGKLFNLIKRADPSQASAKTRKLLESIAEQCKTCQFNGPIPLTFKASIPGIVTFNRSVILDLMWILGKPVLHVIDADTHYSAARFLQGESTEHVWRTFLECWVTTYVGFPDIVKADHGSVFTSKKWSKYSTSAGVAIEIVPVESSNSMGVGERYHEPLRRIFMKVMHDHPGSAKELVLALATKAMNDTCGPEGLVPSFLVYGIIPRLPSQTSALPGQAARMQMIETARREMEAITTKLRLRTVLRKRAPKAAYATLEEGDPVLVWRKRKKFSKWTGPFTVLKIEGKVITITDATGEPKEFNASAVKLYVQNDVPMQNGREPVDQGAAAEEQQSDDGFSSDCPQTATESDSLSDSDYDPSEDKNHGYSSGGDQYVYLTEVLPIGDKRGKENRFAVARDKEIAGLKDLGTWQEVAWKDVPKDANVLGSRFSLSLKNVGTAQEFAKARLVVQGHTDREKFNLIHDSKTLHQRSIRVILSTAAMYGFQVWSHDITQAYLQSDSPLRRDVYLIPPKELQMPADRIFKLVKPLYGLSDSGDYWGSTNSRHHKSDLGMDATCGDLSLFYRRNETTLEGLSGIVVDDTLQCGTPTFLKITRRTMDRFRSKERVFTGITFAGINVNQKGECFSVDQKQYAAKLQPLAKASTFKNFRSHRAKLAWLVNTRPDICCAVAKLAQVTEGTFGEESISSANQIVGHISRHPGWCIQLPNLDLDSVQLEVYTDAALANNSDLSSQVGYVIVLRDKFGHVNILDYTSKKCRRVTHSSLAGEILAFSAAFDAAFILKHDLAKILGRRIPLNMMTDSKGLFDMVTKSSYCRERRLMIDIAAIREAYRNKEIDGIAHIPGTDNPADAMTKIVYCPMLYNLMEGKSLSRVSQWVLRSEFTTE